MKATCLALALILVSVGSMADRYPKNPGFDVINYAFRIKLSDQTDKIECEATVDVRYLQAGATELRLDLVNATEALGNKGMTVSRVMHNGTELTYTHQGNDLKINLPSAAQKDQRSQYIISYSGIPATGLKIANNKYGDRTFFSDNWPDKARNWLSVIDHPYDKATCEFILTAPAHYQVISNGLKVEETDLAGGMRLTHWRQSVPIASWLYVLGVARFAVQAVDEFDNKSIETWVYYQDREAGFYDFAIPTRDVLEFYSSHVGPFAYEKLANVQSNSVSGGMEAASAIFYSEGSVVGDRNNRWRNVVIHEIAHQWFGNAVTEYDWDDVWLSEGFATYFTLLFIEHQYGRDAFQEGLASSKKTVMAFQGKNPDYRIVHDQLSDMSKVTSVQTYQKGSWVLHMLRGVLGDDVFWKGIRTYYALYMNRSATTADFRSVMEEVSGMDLKPFFDQWLYRSGTLKVTGSWQYDSKKKEVTITLNQAGTGSAPFRMPLQVAISSNDNNPPIIKTLSLVNVTDKFTFPMEKAPREITLDPDMWVLMESEFRQK